MAPSARFIRSRGSPIVLVDLVGPENVSTYRDPDSGRSSARAVPSAWADLQGRISRYTPHG
jgi:hypothetical protein